MNAPTRKPPAIARKDHEGIILDLLDDIVRAEQRAKLLIDRLDHISKSPHFRVFDIEMYAWTLASIALAAFSVGIVAGFILRGLKW